MSIKWRYQILSLFLGLAGVTALASPSGSSSLKVQEGLSSPQFELRLESSVGVAENRLRENASPGRSGLESLELGLNVQADENLSFFVLGASEPSFDEEGFWVKEAFVDHQLLSTVGVKVGQMHYPLGLSEQNEIEFSRPSLVYDSLYGGGRDIDVGARLRFNWPSMEALYFKLGAYKGQSFRPGDGRVREAEEAPKLWALGYEWSQQSYVELSSFSKDLAFQDALESYALTFQWSTRDRPASFGFDFELAGEIWQLRQTNTSGQITQSYVGSLLPTIYWRQLYAGLRYSQRASTYYNSETTTALPQLEEWLWRAGFSPHQNFRFQIEQIHQSAIHNTFTEDLVDEWVARLLVSL